ncbi:MAG: glycosyltransferase [Candidatus Eisenbacteria bacterium]|nr:glycosyltransferase [Candidatus Eisenbacteria bacterium]
MSASVDVSIVIPVYNEADSLPELHRELSTVLGQAGTSYELVFVDDGSLDGTGRKLESLSQADPHVRAVILRRNFGKSAALAAGFDVVRGRRIITMDGDLQDDPREIPAFLEMLEEGWDLVSGWKRRRHDPISKRWPSKLFNYVTGRVSGVRLHDFNCGFKAYRREVVDRLDLYGELHRFIPVLAARQGFRIGERIVRHHPRRHGISKFGATRFLNGFLDLLTIMFMSSKQRSPLHVFGRLGVLFLAAGGLLNLYMGYIWLSEQALRVRPLLLFGVILVILGIQFITMGLLGEMISSLRRDRPYTVKKRFPPGQEAGD